MFDVLVYMLYMGMILDRGAYMWGTGWYLMYYLIHKVVVNIWYSGMMFDILLYDNLMYWLLFDVLVYFWTTM